MKRNAEIGFFTKSSTLACQVVDAAKLAVDILSLSS
jgi:hypothetical protein